MDRVAEGSEKCRCSAFAKFWSRSFFSFKTVRWEIISLDESSEECHCQSYCQPKQLLISADVWLLMSREGWNQNCHCNNHVEVAGQFLEQERFMNISVTFLWPRYKIDPIVLTVSLLFMPLPLTFPNHVLSLSLLL